jgi:hypothetical protein
MKLLKAYNNALEAIYKHVKFTPDWVIYPIDDRTNMYWQIISKTDLHHPHDYNKNVKFAETIEAFYSDGDYYSDEIHTQRFYEQWIYRGKDLTMIFVDTHTDGNKFFAVFDNHKEQKEKV